MNKPILLASVAAALCSLAACKQKTEVLDPRGPDPMANALANAPAVDLPPPVTASVTFRCKDNSLVYVDFFKGGKQANLRTAKDASPIRLTAANEGDALTADGYSLKGDQNKITLSQPGKGEQVCTH